MLKNDYAVFTGSRKILFRQSRARASQRGKQGPSKRSAAARWRQRRAKAAATSAVTAADATLQGSFLAVSKPKFASKYVFESSRRDLHNVRLCTALKSHFVLRDIRKLSKNANIFGLQKFCLTC